MSVREEEQRRNPNRGLGLAAAAISVGVGAALYYFFNKRPEHPHSEGSTSENWHCEHPQTLYGSPADTSYSTISEHTTTDTSVNDSSFTPNYEDSFSTNHDSLTSDSFYMISSESESDDDLVIYGVSNNVSDRNISRNMSIDNNNEESVFMEIDITPDQIEIDNNESSQEINVVDHVIVGEPENVMNETGDAFTVELNSVFINDVTNALFNNHEITEPTDTSESEREDTTESATSDTSHITIDLLLPVETDDWDITNTSLGVPALSSILPLRNEPLTTRIYNGWNSMVRGTSRPKSGRRLEHLTEEQQMAILRQDAFRERSWSLEECSICFEVMLKDQPLMQLPCAHNFHVACIGPWLQEQQTCPNCRKSAE